jgi:hypothetical protein
VLPFEKLDSPVWADAEPPKRTLYNFPPRGEVIVSEICGRGASSPVAAPGPATSRSPTTADRSARPRSPPSGCWRCGTLCLVSKSEGKLATVTRRRFRRDPTDALFADQSQSILDNLVALLRRSRARNCSAGNCGCNERDQQAQFRRERCSGRLGSAIHPHC